MLLEDLFSKEECALLNKMHECEKRGHGKWLSRRDGYIMCYDCGENLGSFHRDRQPDTFVWGLDTPTESVPGLVH